MVFYKTIDKTMSEEGDKIKVSGKQLSKEAQIQDIKPKRKTIFCKIQENIATRFQIYLKRLPVRQRARRIKLAQDIQKYINTFFRVP